MEAAELLGISERTFRSRRDWYTGFGLSDLDDRRLAPSRGRAPIVEIQRMVGLYRDLFGGFTMRRIQERLRKRHNYTLGYKVTKLHLHRAGLVARANKRSAHSKKRPRRPMVGMMLHQDASTHAWLRCRRLAKDWECLNRNALAFLRWASIRMMMRKLCQKSACSRMDS